MASRKIYVEDDIPYSANEDKQKAPTVFTWRNVPRIFGLDAKVEYLIEDLIPEKAVTMISGISGHGKSVFATAIAGAVAHGIPFLGRVTKRRKVLYCDRENPLPYVKQHIHDLHIEETDNLVYWGIWCEQQPDSPAVASLMELAHEEQPLMVFDSAISFHTGNENSASETRQYMDLYRQLSARGATVLLLHNVSDKDRDAFYRGSSDYKGSVDMAWKFLKTDGDAELIKNVTLMPFKNRGCGSKMLLLKFEDGVFSIRDASSETNQETLMRIVRDNPDSTVRRLLELMAGIIPKQRVLDLLVLGVRQGWLIKRTGKRRAEHYSLANMAGELHDSGFVE